MYIFASAKEGSFVGYRQYIEYMSVDVIVYHGYDVMFDIYVYDGLDDQYFFSYQYLGKCLEKILDYAPHHSKIISHDPFC